MCNITFVIISNEFFKVVYIQGVHKVLKQFFKFINVTPEIGNL